MESMRNDSTRRRRTLSAVVTQDTASVACETDQKSAATQHLVIVTGFERFNKSLYKEALKLCREQLPEYALNVEVYTDDDIRHPERSHNLAAALSRADAVLCSLIFDHDEVQWLIPQLSDVRLRFVFESAPELMALTQVNSFHFPTSAPGAQPKPNASTSLDQAASESPSAGPLRALLSKFGLQQREEDKLAGYLAMLKMGPKLLRWLPGNKFRNVKHWLTVYSYWNSAGAVNTAAMIWYIWTELLQPSATKEHAAVARPPRAVTVAVPDPVQIPSVGLLHPQAGRRLFANAREYLAWHSRWFPQRESWPRVALLLYRKHVASELAYVSELIAQIELHGMVPVPFFLNGVEAHMVVRDMITTRFELEERRRGIKRCSSLKEKEAACVSAIVSTIGFPLVGGPAGSMAAGRHPDVAARILAAKNVPYIVAAPLITQDIASWNTSGVSGMQSIVMYSLPELDGAIDTVPLGGLDGDKIKLVPERVDRLCGRLQKWIALQRKARDQVKLAIVLYSYPPGVGAAGTAALLDVPRSLQALLKTLRADGYDVGDYDKADPEELLTQIKNSNELYVQQKSAAQKSIRARLAAMTTVSVGEAESWLGAVNASRIQKQWGPSGTSGDSRSLAALSNSAPIKTVENQYLIGGVQCGNVWIGLQPALGIPGDPMRLLFEKDMTPHPQYAAMYRWLEHGLKADAVVHFGMHGTVEWLPGVPLGNNAESWPDILLANMPCLYVYAANNPSESALAKRRGYATIISHNVPPYGRAGLYNELVQLKALVAEFRENFERAQSTQTVAEVDARMQQLIEDIAENVEKAGLSSDVAGIDRESLERDKEVGICRLDEYLKILEMRLYSSGLHVLGRQPTEDELKQYIEPMLSRIDWPDRSTGAALLESICDQRCVKVPHELDSKSSEQVAHIIEARDRLMQSDDELRNLLVALRGGYVPPALGGDVLRDGKDVLPTGRNIFSLDPYRMPSARAYASGAALADALIEKHRAESDGAYPETVAVPLWVLDNIKTRGESVGLVLGLVGAKLVCDATGRTASFELIPLDALGRPRIDVLVSMSGIFRDCFEHVVFLLDDMFRRAASAEDEPLEMNFIRKHSEQLLRESENRDASNSSANTTISADEAQSRLFSNPCGDFGSLVNDQVVSGSWTDGAELGSTWRSRNMYAYGRNVRGERQSQTLDALLASTDRMVQEIDSVEYGLTDIQEYYANSGALVRAAQSAKKHRRALLRKQQQPQDSRDADSESDEDVKVPASFIEAFEPVAASSHSNGGSSAGNAVAPRKIKDLDELLRLEYRSKLLNPKWAEQMARTGSGGAYEISQRLTAVLGWGGTVDFADEFVYEQASQRYVLDSEMADRLKRANPEAYRNVVGRLLEAHARGMWKRPDERTLELLRDEYDDIDARIEGVEL